MAWAQHAGAIDAAQARRLTREAAASPRAAAAVVTEAIALREALYRMLGSRERAPHADDVARLNAHLTRASAEPQLVFHGRRYEVGWLESDALTAPLDPIVRDAVDLLVDERRPARACASASRTAAAAGSSSTAPRGARAAGAT